MTVIAPILLLSLSSLALAAESNVDPATGSVYPVVQEPASQEVCSLYLASSAIPQAGLGLFSGRDIQAGQLLQERDLMIPVFDLYKTIPYRSNHNNQRFLSWLGYVWPTESDVFCPTHDEGSSPKLSAAFYKTPRGLSAATLGPHIVLAMPDKADDDESTIPLNVWSPGIASLANSHATLANIEWQKHDDEHHLQLDANWAMHGVTFRAIAPIQAGSELYLHYGNLWHSRHQAQLRANFEEYEYPPLEYYKEEVLPDLFGSATDDEEEEDDWEVDPYSEQYMRDQLPEMLQTLKPKRDLLQYIEAMRRRDVRKYLKEHHANFTSNARPWDGVSVTQRKLSDYGAPPKSTVHPEITESELHEAMHQESVQPLRSLEWLQEHGACLDHVTVAPSTIAGAGRGAFTTRALSKGSVIAPAPLLALRRDDLNIYEIHDKTPHGQGRIALDFDKLQGIELLLNYCFGHAESELLLVPYSPMVNYINHANATKANVKIQWPSDETAMRFLGRTPQEWLDQHPLDVTDQSGKLLMEFVALRDLEPGEELFLDYGADWQAAYQEFLDGPLEKQQQGLFRHEINVPKGFYPPNWLNQPVMQHELTPIDTIAPGEIVPLTWKHNGQHIAQSAFVIGLPPGLTEHIKDFADQRGINSLYRQLLAEPILDSDEWFLFDADQHPDAGNEGAVEQWFAQRFKTESWGLNVHYIAAWNPAARTSFQRSLGAAGFDIVLDSVGRYFGLDHLTCFHESFIGVSHAENSFMHTDVYGTGNNTGFNILFPIITVNGSHPELDIQSDNADHVVAVKYEHDRAFLLSDYGFHRTSTVAYDPNAGEVRVVVGLYCAQMEEGNQQMLKYIYKGEPPAPFFDQFNLPIEIFHWSKDGKHRLPR